MATPSAFAVEQIDAATALDGSYLIGTGVRKTQISAAAGVRNYTTLAHLERAVPSPKTVDRQVRPIRHRPEGVAVATAPRR